MSTERVISRRDDTYKGITRRGAELADESRTIVLHPVTKTGDVILGNVGNYGGKQDGNRQELVSPSLAKMRRKKSRESADHTITREHGCLY